MTTILTMLILGVMPPQTSDGWYGHTHSTSCGKAPATFSRAEQAAARIVLTPDEMSLAAKVVAEGRKSGKMATVRFAADPDVTYPLESIRPVKGGFDVRYTVFVEKKVGKSPATNLVPVTRIHALRISGEKWDFPTLVPTQVFVLPQNKSNEPVPMETVKKLLEASASACSHDAAVSCGCGSCNGGCACGSSDAKTGCGDSCSCEAGTCGDGCACGVKEQPAKKSCGGDTCSCSGK